MICGAVIDITIEVRNTGKARLFCTVPARRFPTAVMRNGIKRWCRAAWRTTNLARAGCTVFVCFKTRELTYGALQDDFKRAERLDQTGV